MVKKSFLKSVEIYVVVLVFVVFKEILSELIMFYVMIVVQRIIFVVNVDKVKMHQLSKIGILFSKD
jgi:hypothetical protein